MRRTIAEFLKRIPPPAGAVLLGALTFVVTPLINWTVAAPFLVVNLVKPGTLSAERLASALHVQDLEGMLAAFVFLLGLSWVLGSAGTAFVSWLIYRSKRLALLTLLSAFGIQVAGTVWSLASVMRKADVREAAVLRENAIEDSAFAETDKLFASYAAVGPPEIFLRERHDNWSDDRPEFGPYFAQVEVGFPVTVSRPGLYRFEVHYEYMRESAYRFVGDVEVRRTLRAGRDTLLVGFRPGLYRSPQYTGGLAWVKAHAVISQREYLDMARPLLGGLPKESLHQLEKAWEELDQEHPGAFDHFVDSSGTSVPRPAVLPKYERPVRRYDRDDRGRPLPRRR